MLHSKSKPSQKHQYRTTAERLLPKAFPLLVALLLLCLLYSCSTKKRILTNPELTHRAAQALYEPTKRELRAAWIPTIYRSEYTLRPAEELQKLLRQRLNILQAAGFNAVIFQIRAEADAWYQSPYEPWSRFLIGQENDSTPIPTWDPLAFMIEECHQRQMELHAWINPYRAAANSTNLLPEKHPYHQHPEWFVTYNNQLLFNPALPEVRSYIAQIVADITSRYDLDAIHLDDYFYPYPAIGSPFPDQEEYLRQTGGSIPLAEWRRKNVSQLIELLHHTIKSLKPYVQLGISPFGIYRNEKSDPQGSKTSGLQNYDDLYADILLWDREGWVDYIMPQLYWPTGHTAAEYTELARWWQRHISRALYYIGQDVKRTMNAEELHTKMNITTEVAKGQCFWPGDEIFRDYKGITDQLAQVYWQKPALPPIAPMIYISDTSSLSAEKKVVLIKDEQGEQRLEWQPDEPDIPAEEQTRYYIIYCHPRKTKQLHTQDLKYLIGVTSNCSYQLPKLDGKQKVAFTITRLNRYNQELPIAKKIFVTL